jgi:hypothetical protein
MDHEPLRVRILVFEDLPGVWTARALEHDIVAEGQSIETAIQAVLRMMRAQIEFDRRHSRDWLAVFAPAPSIYWNAFVRGTPLPWARLLSHMLPGVSEITAAVANERPRTPTGPQRVTATRPAREIARRTARPSLRVVSRADFASRT